MAWVRGGGEGPEKVSRGNHTGDERNYNKYVDLRPLKRKSGDKERGVGKGRQLPFKRGSTEKKRRGGGEWGGGSAKRDYDGGRIGQESAHKWGRTTITPHCAERAPRSNQGGGEVTRNKEAEERKREKKRLIIPGKRVA